MSERDIKARLRDTASLVTSHYIAALRHGLRGLTADELHGVVQALNGSLARVEALEAERDTLKMLGHSLGQDAASTIRVLKAENERLREALVTAAVPLEALNAAGWASEQLHPAVRAGVSEAVTAIRHIIAPPGAPAEETGQAQACGACGHPRSDHNTDGLGECYHPKPGGGLCQCIKWRVGPPAAETVEQWAERLAEQAATMDDPYDHHDFGPPAAETTTWLCTQGAGRCRHAQCRPPAAEGARPDDGDCPLCGEPWRAHAYIECANRAKTLIDKLSTPTPSARLDEIARETCIETDAEKHHWHERWRRPCPTCAIIRRALDAARGER